MFPPIVILWWLKLVSSRKPFQKLVFRALRRISARPTSRTPSHLHRFSRCLLQFGATSCSAPPSGFPMTQLFGSRASPVNFSRIPIWTYRVMAIIFAAAMSSCVDDVICVERMTTIQSAYRCWRRLCDLLGWDVPDSKSPPPERALRMIGIWLDLSKTLWEPFLHSAHSG